MAAMISCVMLANETQAQMIIIPTVSGRTVYYLNSLRIGCLVLAVTTNIRSFRLMQIKRGAVPLLYNGNIPYSVARIVMLVAPEPRQIKFTPFSDYTYECA